MTTQKPLDLDLIKARRASVMEIGQDDEAIDALAQDIDALIAEVERLQVVEAGLRRQIADYDGLLGRYKALLGKE